MGIPFRGEPMQHGARETIDRPEQVYWLLDERNKEGIDSGCFLGFNRPPPGRPHSPDRGWEYSLNFTNCVRRYAQSVLLKMVTCGSRVQGFHTRDLEPMSTTHTK